MHKVLILDKLSKAKKLNKTLEIPLIKSELKPHQQTGGLWLALCQRALLADPIGSGKTLTSVAGSLLKLKEDKIAVVVPGSALYQWQTELQEHTELESMVYRGTPADRLLLRTRFQYFDVIVLTYNLLSTMYLAWKRNPNKPKKRREWHEFHDKFKVAILDEATAFKNEKSHLYEAVKSFSKHVQYFFPVAALPIENNLMEYRTILSVIDEKVSLNVWDFKVNHCSFKRKVARRGGREWKYWVLIKYRDEEQYIKRVEHLFIRRPWALENMPPITNETIMLDMTPGQQRMYDTVVDSNAERYKTELPRQVDLQRICDTTCGFSTKYESPKISWIEEALEGELKGEQVLIFSEYKNSIKHVKQVLDKLNIRYGEISGDYDMQERERFRLEYNQGNLRVLVMTIAGHQALNLQAGRIMICINRLWNPVKQRQLIGRVWRSGQKRSVVIFNLVSRNSMDEYIAGVLSGKIKLIRKWQDDVDFRGVLTKQELREAYNHGH